jgi:S-adenosylmethionine hydrolase
MLSAMAIIALLTDFGTRDPYVAAVKGVIAARCDARVFDLTHEIAPFDVFGAAWFLRGVAAYWPEGTIFVAVVDPGVGTARKIIALECDGRIFLAPDNGLLSLLVGDVWSVENESFFLPQGSSTFHGRDRFAPVAAAIANGLALDELGPCLDDIVRLDYAPPSYAPEKVDGTIVAVDRFGNLVTDIEAEKVAFDPVLRAGRHVVDRLERNYGDAGAGPFLIAGSAGCFEVSVANGSAADLLQLSRGEKVSLTPK